MKSSKKLFRVYIAEINDLEGNRDIVRLITALDITDATTKAIEYMNDVFDMSYETERNFNVTEVKEVDGYKIKLEKV